jgi:hypothetical protein
VANANLVTISAVTLSDGLNGGLASNYSLATGQTAAASITARALTVTGVSALDRVYDGTTAATLTGGALIGVVDGESVALERSGSFATPFVGQQIAVASSSVLSGADIANYSLVQPSGLTANILPVINAASLSNGVDPAAAYESARTSSPLPPPGATAPFTFSANTALNSQNVTSPLLVTSPSNRQTSSGGVGAGSAPASMRHIGDLNLTIIGTGLNAPEWIVGDPEEDKK